MHAATVHITAMQSAKEITIESINTPASCGHAGKQSVPVSAPLHLQTSCSQSRSVLCSGCQHSVLCREAEDTHRGKSILQVIEDSNEPDCFFARAYLCMACNSDGTFVDGKTAGCCMLINVLELPPYNFLYDGVILTPETISMFISCLSSKGLSELDDILLPLARSHPNLPEYSKFRKVTIGFNKWPDCQAPSFGNAMGGDCVPCMYKLMAAGQNPTEVDPETGETAMHRAAALCSQSALAFLFLNGAAAQISIQDTQGCTPIHFAVNSQSFIAQQLASRELSESHIQRLNACSSDECCAAVISILARKGADLEMPDFAQFRPICAAVSMGNVGATKELIRLRAKTKVRMKHGVNVGGNAVGETLESYCRVVLDQTNSTKTTSKRYYASGEGRIKAAKLILDAIDEGSIQICSHWRCLVQETKDGKRFQKCGRCLAVKYCSKECALDSWPVHSKVCVLPAKPEVEIEAAPIVERMRSLMSDPTTRKRRQTIRLYCSEVIENMHNGLLESQETLEALACRAAVCEVEQVNANSPANDAGLQQADAVVLFSNTDDVEAGHLCASWINVEESLIPALKNRAERQLKALIVRTNYTTDFKTLMWITMTPSSEGTLGCELIDYRRVFKDGLPTAQDNDDPEGDWDDYVRVCV